MQPADVDEPAISARMRKADANVDPKKIAAVLAAAKAEDVSGKIGGSLIIGADQVLALGDELLSKAPSIEAAREALRKLRGRTHELHSAVAFAEKGKIIWTHVGTARLTMRDFSDAFLDDYLLRAGDRVGHSVGAYELEGLGVQLFDKIEGDYFTVLGPAAAAGARRAAPTWDHSEMKRACVIGWPIEHSRSPLIHGYWLKQYGIDGAYTKEAVRPEEVHGFLRSLEAQGFVGCNVTVPHKETAYALADERDASARAVQAANTLWVEGGKLHAANTDTYGYMTYLDHTVPDWKAHDGPVCVLGAGGAARAIVHGFLEAGSDEVRVFNRTRERAEQVAEAFGPRVKAFDWNNRSDGARDACVLVNTTGAGLKGGGSLGMDFAGFNEDCVVSDIVYVPLETQLLAQARAARTAHCGWPGYAAPSSCARLREMVRRASTGHRQVARHRRRQHRGSLV